MNCSLHGELASRSREYFVGDGDFLDPSPVVLVAPHVAPPQEVSHRQHRDAKSSQERLFADDREEEEGE